MASSRRGRGHRIEWNGRVIAAKVRRAAATAINETMAQSVIRAKSNHPGWSNRTGTAEGSIRIEQVAVAQGAQIIGKWGSTGVEYMRWLEFLHGSALRGAADVEYRSLQERIKRRVG